MQKQKGRVYLVLLMVFLLIFNINLVLDNFQMNNTVSANSIIVDFAGSGNYTTIQAAINAANNGDTIYVWAGTYNEPVIVNKTITLIGNGTGTTVINGSGARFGDAVRVESNFVNISGFTITGSGTGTYMGGIRLHRIINCTISNNVLINNQNGIYHSFGSGHKILNNTCINNVRGIFTYTSDGNLIQNNTIDSNSERGIYLYSSDYNTIGNNNCTNNSQSIYLLYSNSNDIENNNCDSGTSDDIILWISNYNKLANNSCNGITLSYSGSNSILNNTMGPTSITITGNTEEHWNQTVDTNNTMGGKIIVFWNNVNNSIIPSNAGSVTLINCENITVENSSFSNISTAITLSYCKNIIIRNNTGTNLSYFMQITSSDQSIIENNTYSLGNNGDIILQSGSNSNLLANNTCGSISFESSGNNTIQNNSLLSSGVSIFGNLYEHWIQHFDMNNTVKNEIIYYMYDKNNTTLPLGGGQVILINCQDIVIENQNYSDKGSGILLGFSDNNKIVNNTCYNNIDPISLWNCNNNVIENNVCINTSNDGIYLSGSDNNIISNNTIKSNNGNGLRLSGSDSNTISNNLCNLNLNDGIYLSQSGSNTIQDNICQQNQENGIYLTGSNGNIIEHNKCTLNGLNGLELYDSDSCTISNNTLNSNIQNGIYVRSSDSTILEDLECNYNYQDGIYINDCQLTAITRNICMFNIGYGTTHIMGEHSEIRKNNCSLNNLSGMYIWGQRVGYEQIPHGGLNTLENNICIKNNGSGITLVETNNNTIKKNLCLENNEHGIENIGEGDAVNWLLAHNEYMKNICNSNKKDGIYFWNGSYCTLYNNTVSQNTQHGLNFMYGLKNEIFNNNINNNVNGLNLFYIENTDIYDNTCYQNDLNLFLENSSSNIIRNNNLSNGEYGAFVYLDSDSNIISANSISDNSNTGLLLSNKCNTNRLYYNNFLTNTKQAEEIDSGPNFWNNNLDHGNYWSDYTGLDNGVDGREQGDGIGDTALPHLDLDYYPFTKLDGWIYPGIPQLLDPGLYDPDGVYTINWTEPRNTIDYVLEESKDSIFSSPIVVYKGNNTHFNVTNSAEGIYYYRVRANNSEKIGDWSNVESIEVNYPPEFPENFTASALSEGNALNVSWKPLKIPDVTEYYLYYKHTEFGIWKLLTMNVHPLNYYMHTGLLNGETYFYRLRVNDTYGHISKYSPEISGIPKDTKRPAPPTGLMIKELNIDSITLSWNASTEVDVVGYNIYRSLVPEPDNWGDPINGLYLYYSTEYTDKDLEEATTYYYVVTAIDEVPNISNYSAIINGTTLLSEYGPEIKVAQADFIIQEDTVDNTTINLFDWFMDRNNDKLQFECKGQTHINVQISDPTGKVILTPETDWNGKETLVFFAYDKDVFAHDEVTVTVVPVNDPPGQALIINPKDGHEVNDSTSIKFEGSCPDIDLPSQDVHTYVWTSNKSGELGTGKTLVKTITQPGHHQIRLTVIDSGGLESNATINIRITKSPVIEPPDGSHINDTDEVDDVDDEDEQDNFFLVTYLVSGIIIIILIILIFLALRKKPEKREITEVVEEEAEAEEDIEEELSEESDLTETEEPELVENAMETEDVDAQLEDELQKDID